MADKNVENFLSYFDEVCLGISTAEQQALILHILSGMSAKWPAELNSSLFKIRLDTLVALYDEIKTSGKAEVEQLLLEIIKRHEALVRDMTMRDGVSCAKDHPFKLSTRRRIVIFLDGTTNTPEKLGDFVQGSFSVERPITNVLKLQRHVAAFDPIENMPQIVGYWRGVGTTGSSLTRAIDIATGRGLSNVLIESYRFVCNNLHWISESQADLSEVQIFIFGFSRGAFTARALSGFLNNFGLLRRDGLWALPLLFSEYQKMLSSNREEIGAEASALLERVSADPGPVAVQFLGVWDTVAALGIRIDGFTWLTADYESMHDVALSPNVQHACQALAAHELREPFRPVFWTKKAAHQALEQVWFPGAHADVGGGYSTSLSDYALDWMAFKAERAGLRLDRPFSLSLNPNERIARSRNWHNGERGMLKDLPKFPRKLERPIALDSIASYLGRYHPGHTMQADVASGIKAHWSFADRSDSGIEYHYERDTFKRIDDMALALPIVDRSEMLA